MKKIIITLFILMTPIILKAENIRTAIQLNSEISEGRYTLNQLAAIAKSLGFKAVIITDRDLQKWEYGVYPLSRYIKKTVQDKSIISYGPKKYLHEINSLNEKYPGVTFIPGTESAPLYWWSGNVFSSNFTMHGWHRHLLAIGMDDPKDYYNIPVIGNTQGLIKGFDYLSLWPLLSIITCLSFFKRYPKSSVFITIISLLFLINSYPFKKYIFNQYQGDNIAAYQNYIDYVNHHNGLTFWAHPDIENDSRIGNVHFNTPIHSELLAKTHDYTGYCIFFEGYKNIGRPQGLWDRLLNEFIQGKRHTPIWAIGGNALDKERDLRERLEDLQTIVITDKNDKDSILSSLRCGKMYVAQGENSLHFDLERYNITDTVSDAYSGETLKTNHDIHIHIKCAFNDTPRQIKLIILRNGEHLTQRTLPTPVDFDFQDKLPLKKTYYRIEITAPGLSVITNPIFVIPENDKRSTYQ